MQLQNKIAQGFKNEENPRLLVRKELAIMKDESGSTVCSEASTGVGLGSGTFARPQPLSSRWNDTFIPRKVEFKGWVTGYT